MAETQTSTVSPTPIALVICDDIYLQQNGAKKSLIGLFDGIGATQFPVTHPRMAIFVSMTGVRNNSIAKIELINGETEDILMSAEGEIPVKDDPLAVVDIAFTLNNITFPEPGKYFVRLWSNNYLLLMRPFHVAKVKPADT